jgi:hypothetical protein
LVPVTTPFTLIIAWILPPPPPSPTQQPLDTQGMQDSLSFPPIDEVGELRASNSNLKD